jgi:hypothetical protein
VIGGAVFWCVPPPGRVRSGGRRAPRGRAATRFRVGPAEAARCVYALRVTSQVGACRRNRKGVVRRFLAVLGFRRELERCGDFLLDEPPPDTFVREPLRPKPFQPGGAIALELPGREDLD